MERLKPFWVPRWSFCPSLPISWRGSNALFIYHKCVWERGWLHLYPSGVVPFPFGLGTIDFFLFLRISSRTTSFFSAKHFVRFCHPDLLPNRCSWYIYIYNISKNTLACSQKLKTTSVLISRHAALPPEPQSPRCLSVCVFFCKRWLCSPVKSIHYDSLACRIIFNGYFFSCGFSQSSKSLWKNFSPFLLQFIEALI